MPKILIVDDSTMNRELLKEVLKSSDSKYELIEADSGTKALELCKTENPDLILFPNVFKSSQAGFDKPIFVP